MTLENAPTPFFEEPQKFIAHGRIQETMVNQEVTMATYRGTGVTYHTIMVMVLLQLHASSVPYIVVFMYYTAF